MRWFGNGRADNLTSPEFVAKLRQSGCWMLSLGIESESDDVRRDMMKRLEREKIRLAIRNLRDAGIKSFAFFIFGYPGDTPASIERTARFAREIDPDFANFYPAVPYPGTEMYEKCRRDGTLVTDDWSKLGAAVGFPSRMVMVLLPPEQPVSRRAAKRTAISLTNLAVMIGISPCSARRRT